MIYLLVSAGIAFVTYLLIPGIGAFRVRSRWRKFRARVQASAILPEVRFSTTVDPSEGLKMHRFLGQIEALQGENVLWVRGEDVTIRVHMNGAELYVLPPPNDRSLGARALLEGRLPDESPRILNWKTSPSLQEGARILLVGYLDKRDGMLTLQGSLEHPVLGLIHEGEFPIARAIWSGRQQNEYWNEWTPWALVAGALSLFVLASATFRSGAPREVSWLLLVFALFPLLPLAPPGLALFMVYLSNWRRGRFNRAERDILGLAAFLRAGDLSGILSGWGDDFPTDTVSLIRSCRQKALMAELGAIVAFLAGFSLNAVLVFILLVSFA